jgi:hypothetical protein
VPIDPVKALPVIFIIIEDVIWNKLGGKELDNFKLARLREVAKVPFPSCPRTA